MDNNLKAKFSNIIVYEDSFQEKRKNLYRTFHTLAGECIGDFCYMFGTDSNNICKVELSTGNIEVMYGDEMRPCGKKYLYLNSILYGKYIYFLSHRKQCIIKFDPVTNNRELLFFDRNVGEFSHHLYKNWLFLLPIGYSEQFICIDLDHDNIKYLPTNYKSQLNPGLSGEQYIFVHGIDKRRGIYRGSYLNPCIQQYNIQTGKFQYIEIKEFGHPIRQLAYDGDSFWILSQDDGTLIQWNEESKKIKYFIDLAEVTGKQGMLYATCFYHNGFLYITERQGSCILELNVKEKQLLVYDCGEIPGFKLDGFAKQAFAESIRIDTEGRICFFPFCGNGIVLLDKEKEVRFYRTETAKLLGRGNNQQEQTEYISTLDSFLDRTRRCDRSDSRRDDIGRNILQSIYKETNAT